MEIERKFLVTRLPEHLERFPCRFLEQAYLSTDPVIRVRRIGGGESDRYVLTVKGDGLLSREEFELPLTEDQYGRLLARAEGNRIGKSRYRIPWEGVTIELDVFAPPFAPLVYAEVEFPDEAAARAFSPPDWFGREVTYAPAYTNAALSRRVPDT
ncbi:MAG: CYTH domain-containing protein [Oscillibacter sp.]|nr:CYTH domain-containing protein [Oscillibacter sp.]